MPRWSVEIPRGRTKIRLTYGLDRHIGFFAVVLHPGGKVEYDALHQGYTGLPGLLDFLVESGVFTRDDMEEGLEALLTADDPGDIEGDAGLVAEMVCRIKMAAAED